MSSRQDVEVKLTEWIEAEKNWIWTKIDNPGFQVLYSISDGLNVIYAGIEKETEQIAIHYKADMIAGDKGSYLLAPNRYDFWYGLKTHLMLMGINTIALPNQKNQKALIYSSGFILMDSPWIDLFIQ